MSQSPLLSLFLPLSPPHLSISLPFSLSLSLPFSHSLSLYSTLLHFVRFSVTSSRIICASHFISFQYIRDVQYMYTPLTIHYITIHFISLHHTYTMHVNTPTRRQTDRRTDTIITRTYKKLSNIIGNENVIAHHIEEVKCTAIP